jgi:branched-chain amino acid transport system permease protein
VTALVQRLRRPPLTTDYANDLKLFPSWAAKAGALALAVLFFLLPNMLEDFWLGVLVRVGIFAIGAIGLNLLTGYTGQVSLGHAFFLAVGAYTWAHFGGELGWSILLWLPLAAFLGALVGAVVGPFALRLRGNYLAIVSLGLVFIGLHIWNNFESVTGGSAGVRGDRAVTIGPLDFAQLDVFGRTFSDDQSYFWLIWFVVAVGALLAKNIVRTRPGRAMQAVRDRDVAAEVVGVNLARYKVGAFALSSAYAAVAGALLGSYSEFIVPDQWSLPLAIQFVAIIIVGGVGTIFGSILGALFIAGGPLIIDDRADSIPLVSWLTEQGGMSTATFNQLLFGLVIILFLVLEPHGLAGIWFRIRNYFRAWPFSY